MKPSKQTLHFPTALISAQRSSVLSLGLSARSVRRDKIDSKFPQFLVQWIAVVSRVSYQFLWPILGKGGVQSLSDQRYFVGRSASHVNGDRKTISVCDCHDLAPFPAFRRANTIAPFFADENEPSINPSPKSIFPRSSRSLARARRTASRTPSSVHLWKRRWHVWYGGYRSGMSFQGAPVRRTQRMPLSTSRLDRHGRPRPSVRRGNSGRSGSMISHCLSVRSMARTPCSQQMQQGVSCL